MTATIVDDMPVFHDRRTGEITEYNRGSEEYLGHLYGSGEEGMKHLFPGQQSDALTPWHGVGGIKNRRPYEQEKVRNVLSDPQARPTQVDPRTLSATQPSITRAGVEHYRSPEYQRTGQLFADRENAGNIHPVVYSRTHPETGRVDNMLLSGHHRAAAALLSGQFLKAHHVEGGYGEEW